MESQRTAETCSNEEYQKALKPGGAVKTRESILIDNAVKKLEADIGMKIPFLKLLSISANLNTHFIALDQQMGEHPDLEPMRDSLKDVVLSYSGLIQDCLRLKNLAEESRWQLANMIKQQVIEHFKPFYQRGML